MSEADESVTQWIEALKEGDDAAAARLWQRYYKRLVGLAYQKIRARPRRAADEEDVVVDAFQSFCQRTKENRFPDLKDRNDLWRLVVRITERKAFDQLRAQSRKKRGSGRVSGESALMRPDQSGITAGIDRVSAPEPTPQLAAEMAESMNRLFASLDDDELRAIAQKKLEGYTNEEIAAQIGRSLPTVERRLKMIREIWSEGLRDE
jgi:RNA polymerase sigma factor (sigma-70 family)